MSEADRLFFVEQVDDTILRIGEMFAVLAKDIAWMKPRVARIEIIEQDIKPMKVAITETNKVLAEVKEDLAGVKLDLTEVKEEITELRGDIANTNTEMRRQNNRYESRFLKLEQS